MISDKSGLLHYLKGVKGHPLLPFTETFLIPIKDEYKEWCPFTHGDKVDKNCYELFQHTSGWMDYLKSFVVIAKYFVNESVNIQSLEKWVVVLENPLNNETTIEFEENLENLISITSYIEKEINEELRKITCRECQRLGEAMTCKSEGCFMASTVMAASAIEARLHELVKNRNKKIYREYFETQTLGTLIKLFDKKEFKDKKFANLKKIVPDRHKSLLDIVNTYRILSAHPLTAKIDHKVSESILNLSFLFLLDSELEIKNKKLLTHK